MTTFETRIFVAYSRYLLNFEHLRSSLFINSTSHCFNCQRSDLNAETMSDQVPAFVIHKNEFLNLRKAGNMAGLDLLLRKVNSSFRKALCQF